jgi:hypothetical protein
MFKDNTGILKECFYFVQGFRNNIKSYMMKKAIIIMVIAAMAIGGTITTSCKKKTKDPTYPQLVGTWNGTTSQAIPIQVAVTNNGGDLYVTSVTFKYSRGPGDTVSLHRYNSDGLSMLSGTSFYVVMDGTAPFQTVVQGTFRTDTLKLNGSFTGYTSEFQPVPGTYTAFRSK